MASLTDFLENVREDLAARYRSPILVPFLFSFAIVHWKVLVYALSDGKRPEAFFALIESTVSIVSCLTALLFSLGYVLVLPWLELLIAKLATPGRNRRDDHQYQEQQQALARRKVIAEKEEEILKAQLRNAKGHTKLQDIEQLRQYQSILSGENLSRWVKDFESGALHPQLETAIINYLYRHDTIEGRFVDLELETLHQEAVEALSTLASALRAQVAKDDEQSRALVSETGKRAVAAQQRFRALARAKLEV